MDREERNKKFEEYLHATPAERRKFDLSFLNEPSLPEGLNEELKNASEEYCPDDAYPFASDIINKEVRKAFIAGWKAKEESEKPMNQDELEEEINRTYHDGSVADTTEMDHVDYENIARHFAQWQREQMMREAVEGEISSVDVGDDSYVKTLKISELQKAIRNYNLGDKVRIIVIPNTDEK